MQLVSIVLPTYNGEKFLGEAIDSIVNQTYRNWELIIINDCSNDLTSELAAKYASVDLRIKVIHNNINKGVAGSLNVGFAQARGEYLTWTSDDNYYLENAIKDLVEYLNDNPEYVMVHSAYVRKIISTNTESVIGIKTTPEEIIRQCTCGPCFMYRASAAKAIGDYDTNLRFAQDWDYWLRMMMCGDIGYINAAPYVYRLHEDCLTVKNNEQLFLDDIKIKKKYTRMYAERFPELKEKLRLDLLLNDYDDTANKSILKELRKLYPVKVLYKEYKKKYSAFGSEIWLIAIKSLGFFYILKAFRLKFKYRKVVKQYNI